ncbi:MAG: tRNA (guanine(10)-N(2))-dimethyltransferase, partial [Candidatus Nanohaloarchaea archaeon]
GERGFTVFAERDDEPDRESEVFYNDDMVANRDLSKVAAEVFIEENDIEEARIADALAASGIRGFRYSELGNVVMNDADPSAVEAVEKGLEENGIDAEVVEKDANVFLSEHRNYFNVIDVDPFGPFTAYLDSAARAANYQSLAGLTATDNAAPAGSYPKVCERRYGSTPLKNSFMHETGLRIYLKEAFRNFARHDKDFDPRLCWHQRHYSRVTGRVTESKQRANSHTEDIGYLSFCPSCRWRRLERNTSCPVCGTETRIAGPLWTGKFADRRFTERMLEKMPEDWEKAREILEMVHNEAEILTPFYDLHELASVLDIQVPQRDRVIEEIDDKGYPVSRTHFSPTGLRTDAPIEDVKKIIEEVARE